MEKGGEGPVIMNTLLYVLRGVLAVLGRLFGQLWGNRTELDNRRRELRVQHLLGAWRQMARAGRRGDDPGDLEQALADVQLFGTPAQADQAARVARTLNDDPAETSALDDLLETLRVDLRDELRLGKTQARLVRLGDEGTAYPRASSIAADRRGRLRAGEGRATAHAA
jgi:hypothetical protein